MTQQTIKVLVGASLPTCKGPGKVARAIERLVNLNVSCKLVVVRQRYGSYHIRPQTFNDSAADQFRRLLRDFGDDTSAPLLSKLNMHGPVAQGSSVRNLAPSVSAARVAFSLLLLAAKVLPQRAASCFVKVSMLVKRIMTDWQFAGNLLKAPLKFKQAGGLLSHSGRHCGCVAAFLRTLSRSCAGLLWPVAFKAPIARTLPADSRFVSIQQLGNLSFILSGFHQGLELMSFNLAGMFVVHG